MGENMSRKEVEEIGKYLEQIKNCCSVSEPFSIFERLYSVHIINFLVHLVQPKGPMKITSNHCPRSK